VVGRSPDGEQGSDVRRRHPTSEQKRTWERFHKQYFESERRRIGAKYGHRAAWIDDVIVVGLARAANFFKPERSRGAAGEAAFVRLCVDRSISNLLSKDARRERLANTGSSPRHEIPSPQRWCTDPDYRAGEDVRILAIDARKKEPRRCTPAEARRRLARSGGYQLESGSYRISRERSGRPELVPDSPVESYKRETGREASREKASPESRRVRKRERKRAVDLLKRAAKVLETLLEPSSSDAQFVLFQMSMFMELSGVVPWSGRPSRSQPLLLRVVADVAAMLRRAVKEAGAIPRRDGRAHPAFYRLVRRLQAVNECWGPHEIALQLAAEDVLPDQKCAKDGRYNVTRLEWQVAKALARPGRTTLKRSSPKAGTRGPTTRPSTRGRKKPARA